MSKGLVAHVVGEAVVDVLQEVRLPRAVVAVDPDAGASFGAGGELIQKGMQVREERVSEEVLLDLLLDVVIGEFGDRCHRIDAAVDIAFVQFS